MDNTPAKIVQLIKEGNVSPNLLCLYVSIL